MEYDFGYGPPSPYDGSIVGGFDFGDGQVDEAEDEALQGGGADSRDALNPAQDAQPSPDYDEGGGSSFDVRQAARLQEFNPVSSDDLHDDVLSLLAPDLPEAAAAGGRTDECDSDSGDFEGAGYDEGYQPLPEPVGAADYEGPAVSSGMAMNTAAKAVLDIARQLVVNDEQALVHGKQRYATIGETKLAVALADINAPLASQTRIASLFQDTDVIPNNDSNIRVTSGEALRARVRVPVSRSVPFLAAMEAVTVELDDYKLYLDSAKRRFTFYISKDASEEILHHISQYAHVGVNFLVDPDHAEPQYEHYLGQQVLANGVAEPVVVGAPFRAQACRTTVQALRESVVGKIEPGRKLLVIPLFLCLDYALISERKSAAVLLVQPMNYVGPFARKVEALVDLGIVGALDISTGAGMTDEYAMHLKRDAVQKVWAAVLLPLIKRTIERGGLPLDGLAGSNDKYQVFFAPGLRMQDHQAQASELLNLANRCQLCTLPYDKLAPVSEARASAALRDGVAIRNFRLLAAHGTPAQRADAIKRLRETHGAHYELHWTYGLTTTGSNADGSPASVELWRGSTTSVLCAFRAPMHQFELGLLEKIHRHTLALIISDICDRSPAVATKDRPILVRGLVKRAENAQAAFDDGVTGAITSYTELQRTAKLSGDKRKHLLVPLLVSIGSDSFIIQSAAVRRPVCRAISLALAAWEVGRAFAFTQRQLDVYLAVHAQLGEAYMATFSGLDGSEGSCPKVHAQLVHRAYELQQAGAPAARTEQHAEARNKQLGGDYDASNKQSLAGVVASASDRAAAALVSLALPVAAAVKQERAAGGDGCDVGVHNPVGAAVSVPPAVVRTRHCSLRGSYGTVDGWSPEWKTRLRRALRGYASSTYPLAPLGESFTWAPQSVKLFGTAELYIPGRLSRGAVSIKFGGGAGPTGKAFSVILGPDAAGVGAGAFKLRELRASRVLAFIEANVGGSRRQLAFCQDYVTCTTTSPRADDRSEAVFCRDAAFVMLPLREADAQDVASGSVPTDTGGFRVVDFLRGGDVHRQAHIMPRSRYNRSRPRETAVKLNGDYYMYIGRSLHLATGLPWSEEASDWLPLS